MSAHTNIQILKDSNGNPAFAVIPYDDYLAITGTNELIPHEVVSKIVDGVTPIKAWREYLNLTQEEVAAKLNISQAAYAQQESVSNPRKATREKIATVLGITLEQLDI